MVTEETPKDKKLSIRKRFGKKPQQPDHDSTLTQIQPVAPSPQADAGNGVGTSRPHRRVLFSFLKPKPKGQNGGVSNQAGGSNTTPTESEDLKKLDPWSRAYAKLRNDGSTKRLVQIY